MRACQQYLSEAEHWDLLAEGGTNQDGASLPGEEQKYEGPSDNNSGDDEAAYYCGGV